MMKRSDAQTILASRGWMSDLEPEFASAVFQAGRLVEFGKGYTVYHPGDSPGGMYGLVKGGIVVSSIGLDGMPVAAHIIRQCNWFGYASVLDKQKRALMPTANEPCLMLHVPLAEINALRDSFPAAISSFRKLLISGQFLYVKIVTELLMANTDRRLAAVLLRVTGAVTPDRPQHLPINPLTDPWASPEGVPLTQALLVEIANASPHTVTRFVERVAAAGWIDWRYRRVRILDAASLLAFAAGKCTANQGHA